MGIHWRCKSYVLWPDRNRSDGKVLCVACKEWKEASNFAKKGEKLRSYCRPCDRIILKRRADARRKTLQGYLQKGMEACIVRHRKRGYDGKSDLTIEFLLEQWSRQGGKCFYTDEPMTHCPGAPGTNVSFDRFDNTIGYLKSNIVLCTWRINQAKNNLTTGEILLLANKIRPFHQILKPSDN